LLLKTREIDEEIEQHQQKFPCLDSHCKVMNNMMQQLKTEQATASSNSIDRMKQHHTNASAASSSVTHPTNLDRYVTCPTSITSKATETSSITTAASND